MDRYEKHGKKILLNDVDKKVLFEYSKHAAEIYKKNINNINLNRKQMLNNKIKKP